MGMTLAERVESFAELGEALRGFREDTREPGLAPLVEAAARASVENPWFTPDHIRTALNSLGMALQPANLDAWISRYGDRLVRRMPQKTIGVVMAGNIPAVGFHDFLCVLVAGHKLVAKLSSADARLLPAMAEILCNSSPQWRDAIAFTTGRLEGFDAIIATGSDNTARHFDFYFGKYPHIIRHNRNSIAVLDGSEDSETLHALASDIMLYFGMGCRSVSKIFVPAGYDFKGLTEALGRFGHFIQHNKYANNYDYGKVLFLMNGVPFIDAGCLLLAGEETLNSRIAVLHYAHYQSPGEVAAWAASHRDQIQCVVSAMPMPVPSVMPGEAQKPALWDYADDVDTIDFLISVAGS
jgi:acyl-CoA reductase-like NAD-dependent aldehyde dehydrogenase